LGSDGGARGGGGGDTATPSSPSPPPSLPPSPPPSAGGIVRYLEAFPEGGFFHGKNFVFDERVSVAPAGAGRTGEGGREGEREGGGAGEDLVPPPCPGPSSESHRDAESLYPSARIVEPSAPSALVHLDADGRERGREGGREGRRDVVGSCQVCAQSWDDYKSRTRCRYCRMLLLVCDACRDRPGRLVEGGGERGGAGWLCEHCQPQREEREVLRSQRARRRRRKGSMTFLPATEGLTGSEMGEEIRNDARAATLEGGGK